MAITNYQIPGVYVTQSGTSLTTVSPTNLNIAIVADQPVPGVTTDTFYVASPASGTTFGALSSPMVNTSSSGQYNPTTNTGFTVTWVSGSTTVTGTYGYDYSIITNDSTGISYFTTSGTTAPSGSLPFGTVMIQYGHNWGAYGTYYNYNSLVNTLGVPVSGTTIVNPAVLASYFAFLNGASTVSIMPVARLSALTNSGVTTAQDSDWISTFSINPFVTSLPTQLSSFTGVDVVVPLYGFAKNGTPITGSGSDTVTNAILNYIDVQAQYASIYQRFFLGVDGTSATWTAANMQNLSESYSSSRVSVVFPTVLNFNPGLNINTGLSNVTFNIPGYYLASAVAGLFVGQPDVSYPITNKKVNGFNDIPNQISEVDAQTNYLPFGVLTVRKKRDGNLWVLHALTTDTTNWLTQEVSINAIGDRLATYIKNDLVKSQLIGSPLTKNTFASALSTVQGTLTNAVSTTLIQAFQNLSIATDPNNPTNLLITFQYAPTYPINYIHVTFSLNSQTGQLATTTTQSNFVTY